MMGVTFLLDETKINSWDNLFQWIKFKYYDHGWTFLISNNVGFAFMLKTCIHGFVIFVCLLIYGFKFQKLE